MEPPDNYRWEPRRNAGAVESGTLPKFLSLWSLVAVITLWVYLDGRGTTSQISTNVRDAAIFCDGRGPLGPGAVSLPKTPFGVRKIQARHIDYAPFDGTVTLGWFSDNTVSVQMRQLPVDLVVRTEPGAEVLINGQLVGRSSSQGVFRKTDARPGAVRLTVRLRGYHDWSNVVEMHPPSAMVPAYLAITPARAAEIAQQQQIVAQLLSRAQALFNARQYREALGLVEQALTIDPQNGYAMRLRDQISQTMKILGQG